MANRYWVGGSADWNGTAGTKWASTSGGAGGQTVPSINDDVFFDAASGSATVNRTTSPSVRSLDCAGFTGTLACGSTTLSLGAFGAGAGAVGFRLSSGMTYTGTGTITLVHPSGGRHLFDTAGISLECSIAFSGPAGVVLGSSIVTTGSVTASTNSPVIDFAGFNLTVLSFTTGATVGYLNCTGTITLTGVSGTVLNLQSSATGFDSAAFVFTGAGTALVDATFNTRTIGSLSVSGHPLRFSASGSPTLTVTGDVVFANANTAASGWDISSASGQLQLAIGGTLTGNGSAGNLLRIQDTDFSKSSGTVSLDYLSLATSAASGGATFYAGANSTDVGGNTGWIFSSPPTPSNRRRRTILGASK